LSNTEQKKKLYRAFYKNIFFHFNNSFNLDYLKDKLKHNYGERAKKFKIKSLKFDLKKFDNLNLKEEICFIKIDVEGFDEYVLYGMKNFLKKNSPIILVEYNECNFSKIHNFLKYKYNCYFYNFDQNKLKKLRIGDINKLKKGKILENKYKKNSVNIFFINKNKKKII